MVSTITALGLLFVAVLPGAVATFLYERSSGPVRGDGNERLLRFVFATALLSPLVSAFGWYVWTRLAHVRTTPTAVTTYRNRLATGEPISPLWVLVPAAWVCVPALVGWGTGLGRERWVASRLGKSGNRAAPKGTRSWDVVFGGAGPRIVSCRLRDGRCVGGLFGPESYASHGSAAERELVIEQAFEVDEEAIVRRDADGIPVLQGLGGQIRLKEADVVFLRVEAT